MDIKVVANTTASSTTFVRLRAAVTVSDSPTAAVSYTIPVSQVAYIDLALGVILDTTGQFKFIPQVVVVTDDTSFVLDKALAVDFVPAVDLVSVSALKGLADGLIMVDEETFDTLKALADTAPMLDDEAIGVAKLLQDNQQLQELLAKVLSKALADGFAMNDGSEAVDGSTYSFHKGISNVAFVNVAVAIATSKPLQDTQTLADLAAKTPNKLLANVFGLADNETVSALKALADGLTMADDETIDIDKLLQDNPQLQDLLVRVVDKILVDAVTMVDNETVSALKALADSAPMLDDETVSTIKALGDGLTMADNKTILALKALADGFAMNDGSEAVDGSTYSFHKGIQNVTFTSDVVARVSAKVLQDTQTLVDDEAVSALKGLSDAVSIQDTIATLLLFIRNFSDSVSVADDDTFVFATTKVEQITVADTDNIDYQKNIADGFAMNDGSEAVDGSQYSIHKGISNVAFVGDVRSLIFTASRVESVSVADSGVLNIQDYCDLSYFAEDYVGLSQSF